MYKSALNARLAKNTIGDPSIEGVRMGALASRLQVERVKENVEQLMQSQEVVFGDMENFEITGGSKEKGAFFSPILFRNNNHLKIQMYIILKHFGPVSTLIPYKDIDDAVELVKMGKGSLVTSIVTADDNIALIS